MEGEEEAELELDGDLELEADLIAQKPRTIDYTEFAFDGFGRHEVEFVVLESAPPQHHLPLREIANNEVEIMIQKILLTKCYDAKMRMHHSLRKQDINTQVLGKRRKEY